MALNDTEQFTIKRAVREATKKVADMPGRIRDELQQAEAEKREPMPQESYTAIPANLVVAAVDSIKDMPPDLAEICKGQRRACSELGERTVLLYSHQLLAILNAAGYGEPNAPVQGQPRT